MNAFDYFFENSFSSEKDFLIGNETISYRDLFNSVMKLAGQLVVDKTEAKNIILLSQNNLFFIRAYLAILKSGNVCIPLDPGIEKENFKYIKNLTNSDLIFAMPNVIRRLELKENECITPSIMDGMIMNGPGMAFPNEDLSDTCAEIIFTSGSTGEPKGVMISHKNLIANTSSIIKYLALSDKDRMLVVLPFYYCYGLSLLHTHLRVGGSIVLNNSFIFLGKIIQDLQDYACTGFAGVPSHFQILLRKSESFKSTEFPNLRYVTQAGGKLATIFINEFRENQPRITFFVMYGQTEATARLSYLPPEEFMEHQGSIGKSIPDVDLKVVDKYGNKVKNGEIGEIVARGDNVMLGYYKDGLLTSETIKDGWLFTGDLASIDDEGYIYVKARKKEIIKVGGKRVSPKEIEEIIMQIPEVVDCTVSGVYDEILGETLLAKIAMHSGFDLEKYQEKIKKHCSKHLALYKIPQLYKITNSMSISPTGKKKLMK